VVAEALGLAKLQVIETGGDMYQSERQQWDSGNNAFLLGRSLGGRVPSRPKSSSGRIGTLTRGFGSWLGPSADQGSSHTHAQQLLPDAWDAGRPGG
jgi:hypothetical protein